MITQTGLAFFGVAGLALSYHPDPQWEQWSPLVGLVSQPFWLYMTIKHKLWGVLITTNLYTAAWLYGTYQLFFK